MTTAAAAALPADDTDTDDAPASSSRERKPPPVSKNDNQDGQDSYEDAFDASLFLNEEYVTVSVPFGEIEEEEKEEEGEDINEEERQGQELGEKKRRRRSRFSLDLLCSQAASTDFDLTGQVLWPAAALLASYLVAGKSDDEGERGDKTSSSEGRSHAAGSSSACELGAGLGLSGLAAVACSRLRKLVLTDGSDVVLRVLERNAQRVKALAEERAQETVSVSTRLLEWGDEAAAAALREEHSLDGKGFDLLLGADVAYSLSALPALFSTAAMLLREREDDEGEKVGGGGGGAEEEGEEEAAGREEKQAPTFLLGYVSRSAILDRAVPLEAQKAGFDVEAVEGTRRRLPGGQEGWILSLTRKEKKKKT